MTSGTTASPGRGPMKPTRPARPETGGKNTAAPANRSAGHRWGTGRGGMRWGAVCTLGPYLLGLFGLLLFPSARDQFVFIAAATAPFAAIAVGATWLLVMALQRSPGRRWSGLAQGLAAAAVTYLLAAIALLPTWLA